MPYQLKVTIYNAAGEVVRTLFNGAAETLPSGVALSAPAVVAGQGSVTLDLGGALSGANGVSPNGVLSWGATNDNGQVVGGGTYTMKIDYQDPFGQVTSFTQSISVTPGSSWAQVNVFNSAGELVYSLPYPAGSGSPQALDLANTVMAAAYDSAGNGLGAIQGMVKMAGGPDQAFAWDGRGSNGQPVASGVYTLQLVSGSAHGTIIDSRQISIVKAPDGSIGDVKLGPDPAGPNDQALKVQYPPAQLWDANAALYDQAGERVELAQDPSHSGVLALSLGHCSGGLYLVELMGRRPSGAAYRRLFKAAVLR
jgi:flagellar hook assembly protein FlgD